MSFGPILHDFLCTDWLEARGLLNEELSQLRTELNAQVGTILSAVTRGAIMVGNSTPQWSALSIGAANTVLRSNGTDPSWGKVVLTTDVSGILPVTNGGTGTGTAFTLGSVVFAGASGIYTQDNANFFWDATNHRLGIGTTGPVASLNVVGGDIEIGGSGHTLYINANHFFALDAQNLTSQGTFFFKVGLDEVARQISASGLVAFCTQQKLGAGLNSPTAILHIKAGTATANTAPLKFNSGTLLTAPEAGAVEFLTDGFYATTTTGPTRRQILLNNTATAFTAGSAIFAASGGYLSEDNANFFWDATNHRLGVGVASPASRVEILSITNPIGIVRNTSSTGYSDWRLYNDQNSSVRALYVAYTGSAYASAFWTSGPTGEQAAIGTPGNFPITFGYGNQWQATLDGTGLTLAGGSSNGYLGLGTAATTSWRIDAGVGGAGSNSEFIRVNSGASGGAGINLYRNSVVKGRFEIVASANAIITGSAAGDLAVRNSQAILFSADAGTTDHLHIATTGNVGIGTSTPTLAKLQIVNPDTASDFYGLFINQQDTNQHIAIFQVGGTQTHQFSFSGTNSGRVQLSDAGATGIQLLSGGVSYFTRSGQVVVGATAVPSLASGSSPKLSLINTDATLDNILYIHEQTGANPTLWFAADRDNSATYRGTNIFHYGRGNGSTTASARALTLQLSSLQGTSAGKIKGKYVFSIANDDTSANLDALVIDNSGHIGVGVTPLPTDARLVLGATERAGWTAKTNLYAPSDGVLTLWNNAETDFGRLQFGGTTSAFPSLKRSAATLQARLADDSAFAAFTALLTPPAGTATAGTAPLKLTSGTSLTTAEAGAIEFTTDDFFATITTGAARKAFVLDNGSRLTSGKIPVATTNGRLIDSTAALLIAGSIPTIVATTFEKAETGSDANVLTYATGGTDEFLVVEVATDVSALTGTSVVVTLTWKDSNNSTQTNNVTLSGVGDGTINVPINAKASNNVVVSTVFTGVSTAYNISAIITRLK